MHTTSISPYVRPPARCYKVPTEQTDVAVKALYTYFSLAMPLSNVVQDSLSSVSPGNCQDIVTVTQLNHDLFL